MKWGLTVVLGLFFIAGCTTTSSTPELISVQAVPTQRNYYTLTPSVGVNISIQTAIPLEDEALLTPALSATATDAPELWQPIVIVIKPVPAGYAIPPEAVRLEMWAVESLPTDYYQDVDQVINQVALVDLSCYEPILDRMIAPRQVGTGFLPLSNSCEEHPHSQTASYVVVAARDIQVGEIITPSSVHRVLWHYIPQDGFVNLGDVMGLRAETYIFREQILTVNRVKVPISADNSP